MSLGKKCLSFFVWIHWDVFGFFFFIFYIFFKCRESNGNHWSSYFFSTCKWGILLSSMQKREKKGRVELSYFGSYFWHTKIWEWRIINTGKVFVDFLLENRAIGAALGAWSICERLCFSLNVWKFYNGRFINGIF